MIRRYVATIEVYLYAEDDFSAWSEAEKLAKEQQDKYDNRASITELVEQPFGIIGNRSIPKPNECTV